MLGGLFDTERLNQGGWGEECSPGGNLGRTPLRNEGSGM
jgi:hypothetical protein